MKYYALGFCKTCRKIQVSLDSEKNTSYFYEIYIYIYIYMRNSGKLEHFLKTYIVNDLKAINDYQNKSDIRHGTDPYYDVLSKLVTSARYQHQTCKPTYCVTR